LLSRVSDNPLKTPLSESVDNNSLAICDARTPQRSDLLAEDLFGYRGKDYSWHNIVIETFTLGAVAARDLGSFTHP